MKLTEIHTKYNTDKGTEHNYLDLYEKLFQGIRLEKNTILEIGVLHGGSLKLWNEYFPNSILYGIEDFSQQIGFGTPVREEDVVADLSQYERINLKIFDSTNVKEIEKAFGGLKFDIIIDDASHSINNQLANIDNYTDYLSAKGLYVIEDVIYPDLLIEKIEKTTGRKAVSAKFNTHIRHDDCIVYYHV